MGEGSGDLLCGKTVADAEATAFSRQARYEW